MFLDLVEVIVESGERQFHADFRHRQHAVGRDQMPDPIICLPMKHRSGDGIVRQHQITPHGRRCGIFLFLSIMSVRVVLSLKTSKITTGSWTTFVLGCTGEQTYETVRIAYPPATWIFSSLPKKFARLPFEPPAHGNGEISLHRRLGCRAARHRDWLKTVEFVT